MNFIIGLNQGEQREYRIGDVTYYVSAKFERNSQNNLRDRIRRTVVGDFAPLTVLQADDTMASEYACSTVGKEEICSRKKKKNN